MHIIVLMLQKWLNKAVHCKHARGAVEKRLYIRFTLTDDRILTDELTIGRTDDRIQCIL